MKIVLAFLCLLSSSIAIAQKAELPAPTSFTVGDSWEYRQIDNRTKLERGKSIFTVVNIDGVLYFDSGRIRHRVDTWYRDSGLDPSPNPWRVWPLEVGKKWSVDANWTSPDGVTGNTKQDAVVTAYEEVTIAAGKFMAFKIEYKGSYRNSRGSGRQNDIFWYAPDAQTDVKHIRDDGYNMYTQELTRYKHPTN